MEVGAFLEERTDFPGAFGAFFLAADKNSAAGAGGKGREAAVVTSFLVDHQYVLPAGEVNCGKRLCYVLKCNI